MTWFNKFFSNDPNVSEDEIAERDKYRLSDDDRLNDGRLNNHEEDIDEKVERHRRWWFSSSGNGTDSYEED